MSRKHRLVRRAVGDHDHVGFHHGRDVRAGLHRAQHVGGDQSAARACGGMTTPACPPVPFKYRYFVFSIR